MSEEFKVSVGVDVDVSDLNSQINKAQVKPIKLNVDTSNAHKKITDLQRHIKTLSNLKVNLNIGTSSRGSNGAKGAVNEMNWAYKQMLAIQKNIGSLKLRIGGLDSGKNSSQINELRNQLRALEADYSAIQRIFNQTNLSVGQWAKLQTVIETTEDKIAVLDAKVADARANLAKDIEIKINKGKFDSDIALISQSLARLEDESGDAKAAVAELGGAFGNLKKASSNKDDIEGLIKAYDEFSVSLDKAKNKIKEVKAIESQAADPLKVRSLSSDIDVWLNENSAAAQRFGARLQELKFQLQSCDAVSFKNIQAEFREIKKEAQLAGMATQTFGDKLKEHFTRLGGYFIASMSIMEVVQGLRYMANAVLEVDTAMTGLYRVTDLTNSQYDELYSNMISSAKEYGQTLTDTINATSDWVRAGFDANTALGLAEKTAVYQNVSDLDYEEASENLLTSYNGFKEQLLSNYGGDEVAAVGHIVDVLNELDNKFSVTSAGLGEGLSRSASALMLAGNTYEEAAGMIGAVTEVTQDPEKAGSAMKVLSLRLRGMKGELEELGEPIDENVENISKMQGQILKMTGGKVNIFDENGDFKSTYDIMVDIASIYDQLSSTDQADLLETIAGKHRANDVAALINNIDNAIAMEEAAMDSAGSAAEENAKRVDSLQGRLNQLTTAFQAISNSALDSDFLKGAVSGVTAFVDSLGKLIDTVGLLPTIASVAAAALSFKDIGITSIDKQTNSFKLFGKTIDEVGETWRAFKGDGMDGVFGAKFAESWSDLSTQIDHDAKCINNLSSALMSGVPAGEAFENCMMGASDSIKQLAESPDFISAFAEKNAEAMNAQNAIIEENIQKRKQQQVAIMAENKSFSNVRQLIAEYNSGIGQMGNICQRTGMTQTQFAAAVGQSNAVLGRQLSGLNGAKASMTGYIASLVGAKAATIALQAVSLALNAALTMGIGVAISALVTWITDLVQAEDKLAEKVDEVTASYKERHDSLVGGKSDFEGLAESYAKLSKGVDKLTGKNVSLMPEEYEEYQNVVNQIADTIPSLVSGYDAQGNAILNCAGDVDTLTEAYENLIIAENNTLLNGDGEDFNGLSDTLDDFQNAYKELKSTDGGLWAWDHKNSVDASNALEDIFGLPEINKDSIDAYIRDADSVADNVNDRFAIIGQTLKQKMSDMNLNLDGMEAPDNAWATSSDWSEYIYQVYQQYPEVARAAIEDMDKQLDEAAQKSRDSMLAYMETAFLQDDYSNIDAEMQSIANNIVNGLDSEFIHSIIGDKTGDEAKQALTGWIDNFLGALDGMDAEAQEKLESSFNLGDMFSSGEISLGEFKSQIDEVESLIDGLDLDDEVKNQLKLSLNTDEIQGQWQSFVNRMTESGMEYDAAVDFANSLDASEWAAAQELIIKGAIDWKDKTPEEIKTEIESMADVIEAMAFTIDIEAETERIDAVNTALKESVSAAGLSTESFESVKAMYADLDGYDPSKLFEKTSQGIRINREELDKLEDELANTNFSGVEDSLETVMQEYEKVTKELDTCSDATERQALVAKQLSYADKINELSEMQAQYEGLTSAYNDWIQAQEGGEEGDIYDNAESMFEDAQELYEKGLVGTNEFAAATEYLTGKDTSGMSPSEIAAEWEKAAEKRKRYFTKDEDGNQTSDGVNNLLTDISKLNKEWAHLNENGEWDIDMSVEDVAKAAKELGVSAELIEAVLGKGSDYGLDINYDSVYKAAESLETMRTEAQNANETLKELGKTELTFSFESENAEDLDKQIASATEMAEQFKNADGTWNMEIEGAEEAQQILSTLILQKQEVTKPAFMDVSVATIGDEKLGSVIQTLQELQTWGNLYDINVAIGADTTEAQTKIQEVAGKLQTLINENPDIAANLNLNTSDLQSALASVQGTDIQAGATLDPNAVATIQGALQGIDANVLANVGLGDTSALNGMTGEASITPKPTTTDLGDGFTGKATIDVSPNTTNLGSNFTGSASIGVTPYLTQSTVTVTVKEKKVSEADGTAHVNGTAFANGTTGRAFKSGDWGIKGSGVALGGELGQELVVRDGKFFTIGDDGAEFFNYKHGDIIFNAGQTKQLFEQGKIVNGQTRGRAIASGTAFVEGNAFATGVYGGGKLFGSSSYISSHSSSSKKSSSSSSKKSSSKKSSSSDSSSEANKEAEEFEETLDWIEIAIDRIERAISRLDLKASSTFKKWGVRNSALADQIGEVRNEIDLQQRAYDRYIQQANSVGLSENYASKVRDGTIDIETITDEDLNDKIKEYQEW